MTGEGDHAAPPPDAHGPGDPNAVVRPVPVGDSFKVKRLNTPLDRMTRNVAGRRSTARTERKSGRYIKARPARGRPRDVAFDATIRHAAPYQVHRHREGVAFVVERQDIQEKVRVRRTANLILFVVDASWSMAAAERMEATKGAVMSLLVDAYQRRDRVGLIVFQRERARLVLPPTSSVELAQKALKDIPVGGKTPLSSGLFLAYRVMTAARRRTPDLEPLMILLTDGAGNVSMTGLPAQEEAMRMAHMIRQAGFHSVVINMEHPAFDRGLAQKLADALGAPCYSLPELHAESLVRTVKAELTKRDTSS